MIAVQKPLLIALAVLLFFVFNASIIWCLKMRGSISLRSSSIPSLWAEPCQEIEEPCSCTSFLGSGES